MKISSIAAAVLSLALAASAFGETVHQSAKGESAYSPDGGSAMQKGMLESKEAEGSKAVRLKGDVQQWNFVTFWFGSPAPAGKATIRFKVLADSQATADYGVYLVNSAGQSSLGELTVPANAKPGSFVEVDVQVDSQTEWSGVALKKTEQSGDPSPWIESVSVVLP